MEHAALARQSRGGRNGRQLGQEPCRLSDFCDSAEVSILKAKSCKMMIRGTPIMPIRMQEPEGGSVTSMKVTSVPALEVHQSIVCIHRSPWKKGTCSCSGP